jgi:hypothetical protein
MHIVNAKEGIMEEVETLEAAARDIPPGGPAEAWESSCSALRSYCQGLEQAYAKITAVTKAFNSAFLTYREEAYLDKAILDIFNSCLGDPLECTAPPAAGKDTGSAS